MAGIHYDCEDKEEEYIDIKTIKTIKTIKEEKEIIIIPPASSANSNIFINDQHKLYYGTGSDLKKITETQLAEIAQLKIIQKFKSKNPFGE
jgi:hypothetical protein